MRCIATVIWLAASLFFNSAAHAQPSCDTSYTIRSGDTLSRIAAVIFRDASRWQQIYGFAGNSRAIGLNPNLLIPGIVIDIPPCDDAIASAAPVTGPGPSSIEPRTSLTPTSARRPAAEGDFAAIDQALARRAQTPRPVPQTRTEILSPGGFSPIADEDWPGRGLATQIIEAAFSKASQNKEVQIDFVGDRDAHLNLLLRYNKFEFGFPWTKPDCFSNETLSPETQLLCEYEFSDPIYVAAIKIYAPKNLVGAPRRFADLQDSTLCRPSGLPVHDLTSHGLIDGQTVTMERPETTEQCFILLERGAVDYVSDFQFPAEKAISDLSLTPFIDAVPGLVEAAPLHLIAHGDNAEAAYLLMDRFNAGLSELRASGEWDQIVNSQIRQFRSRLR